MRRFTFATYAVLVVFWGIFLTYGYSIAASYTAPLAPLAQCSTDTECMELHGGDGSPE